MYVATSKSTILIWPFPKVCCSGTNQHEQHYCCAGAPQHWIEPWYTYRTLWDAYSKGILCLGKIRHSESNLTCMVFAYPKGLTASSTSLRALKIRQRYVRQSAQMESPTILRHWIDQKHVTCPSGDTGPLLQVSVQCGRHCKAFVWISTQSDTRHTPCLFSAEHLCPC